MKSTLIDAGPLIALFDSSDQYYQRIFDFIRQFKGHFISTWPVITETSHFLNFRIEVQIDFYQWIQNGGLTLIDIDHQGLDRIIYLSKKYSDIPMDLADASMIWLAEKYSIRDIVTIDHDYYIYRTKNREMLNNLLKF